MARECSRSRQTSGRATTGSLATSATPSTIGSNQAKPVQFRRCPATVTWRGANRTHWEVRPTCSTLLLTASRKGSGADPDAQSENSTPIIYDPDPFGAAFPLGNRVSWALSIPDGAGGLLHGISA